MPTDLMIATGTFLLHFSTVFISTNSGMFALRVFQIRNVELPQATPKHTEMVMVPQTSVI